MSDQAGTSQADADLAAILGLAVDSSGVGIWSRDVPAGRIDYSRAWKAMLGYAEHEISNCIEESYRRVHPDDLEQVRATIQAHFDTHTPTYAVEHRLRHKNGNYLWVISRGQVTRRDTHGKALHMCGITTDISATVALSEKLRQSAELLARLTDEVPGLVCQLVRQPDGATAFAYASAGIGRIFGLTPAQAAAGVACVEALIHPDDVAHWRTTLNASAATLERWECEFRVLMEGLPEQWRRGEARPQRSSDGSTIWHGFISDITQHKRIERQLQEAAETDFLTGLPNRRSLMARLGQELARIERDPDLQSAVLMFDLDHFKAVNDRHGHATGDEVLKHFAQLLGPELRRVDAAGRLGGEEFAVLLSGADMHDASAFGTRVRARLAAQPLHAGGTDIAVTVSIGIAALRASDAGVGDALARADAAMYRAKEGGRDRIEISQV